MHRTGLLLLALITGILAGVLSRITGNAGLALAVGALQPLGQLWIRALQMTLVPLIFATVTNGIVQAVRSGQAGRLVMTSLTAFVLLIPLASLLAMAWVHTVLHVWPMPPDPLAGLTIAGHAVPVTPGIAEQLLAIVPANPVAAAAQGQIFPLVVFALFFGFALARLQPAADDHPPRLPAMIEELALTMMRIVGWVLRAAPVGVFVLALGVGAGGNLGLAGLLLRYIGTEIGFALIVIALAYGVIAVSRAVPLLRFARAIAAPQAMAAGTCSSLATMPEMMRALLRNLRLPEPVVETVLPLASSTFRFGTAGTMTISALMATYAAGLHPSAIQLLGTVLAVTLSSFGAPGLPGAAIIYASLAPAMQVLGAPMEIVPLFIAVFNLPDVAITVANVTTQMAITTVIARRVGPLGEA